MYFSDRTITDGSGSKPPPSPINANTAYSEPIWSPDGSVVYFNHRPLVRIYETPPGSDQYFYEFANSLAGFYRLDTGAGRMRRISDTGLGSPSISRDGRWIYYESAAQVWRVATQGDSLDPSSVTQITQSSDGAFFPSISPSGDRLLYDVANGPRAGIHITGSEGGAERLVGATGWLFPDWGPNDSAFVFVGRGNVVTGISIVDTIGIGALELRKEGSYPRWSPDGKSVAFLQRVGPQAALIDQLWLMSRTGSGARVIVTDPVLPAFSWSPDSREIAYVRFSAADTSYINGTIWTVNVETLQKRQVTFNPDP